MVIFIYNILIINYYPINNIYIDIICHIIQNYSQGLKSKYFRIYKDIIKKKITETTIKITHICMNQKYI